MTEYIVINTTSGKVNHIDPATPQTDSIRAKDGRFPTLGIVLNKLSEYGYDLIPGIVIRESDMVTDLVMRREA
jgi:hypothetical protein